METRIPICKKCNQFPYIDFLDYINLSLNCRCQSISRISAKEFKNDLLCEIKKNESNLDEVKEKCENADSEIEYSSELNSQSKFELNEKTINSQMDSHDQKENNESLLKNNITKINKIQNAELEEIEKTNNDKSSEANNEIENKNYENYIYIKEENFYKCLMHNKKVFISYCEDCKFDLCNECLTMNSDVYSNTSISNKKHENHTKIELKEIKGEFDEIDNLIEKIMKNEEVFKKNEYNLTIIFTIIKCFMNKYEKYKRYNLYKSIENAKKFLEKINNQSDLKASEVEYKNSLKINNEEDLKSKISRSKEISSIDIQYKGVIDLSIFNNRVFENIEELILVGNNIKDISFLTYKSFPQLKILNLAVNNLDSNIIPILEKLNPELTDLNLYKNKITDTKIFGVIKKFTKLKLFYIGENKFIFDESNNSYKFPESLEEFGLTGNFDGNNNINFVKRLGIGNVKIFYISRNKITNLKCLQDINFLRLGEFWAISNNITDIKEIINIKNKENLWKINLKQNNIKNFNELFDIIDKFPNLTILNLTGNPEIEQKEVNEMKNKIK